MSEQSAVLAGTVLDERVHFTLAEVCRCCGVSAERILAYVSEGVVEPEGGEAPAWHFTGEAVVRVQTALRLERDLDLNLAGVALALELMDEIEGLRRRLRRLEHG